MPEPTIEATADHAEITGDSVTGHYGDAQQVLDELAGLGVSYDDVVAVLETEGVDKFAASWQQLLETVATALDDSQKGAVEGLQKEARR
jgi:transaldolase